MSVTGRIRDRLRRGGDAVDADALVGRIDALDRFAQAADGYVSADGLRPARAVVERAGGRLALSRDHTVVALAGATGSGKSSLFNALTGMDLSQVGVRRPTTGVTHACVWQPSGATGLLDWLGIGADRRFVRESALDADDEAGLRGLVLLDLPDFDSVNAANRMEVDRLLALVDLIVWVTDPQKYADQVIHDQYLRTFSGYPASTVVVLNQADRLSDADIDRCVADLRHLLAVDGLPDVPVLAVSAIGPRPGTVELRDALQKAVSDRQAALRRLASDVSGAVAAVRRYVGPPVAEDTVDREDTRQLADALARSAGVPTVTAATRRAYKMRAGKSMGWPLMRWIRRTRPDPLRRLRLGRDNAGAASASSLPAASAADRSTATLAVRALADHAAAGLPDPWPDALVDAARSHTADLPDALDRAVVGTDLGVDRKPWWWRGVGALQWLVTLVALAGVLWLLVRVALTALGLPTPDLVKVGRVPLATVLLAGGLLAGILIGLLVKPLVAVGAKRAAKRADRRLRAAVTDVARDLVVAPVRQVLHRYAEARAALTDAGH